MVLTGAHNVLAGAGDGDAPADAGVGGADGLVFCGNFGISFPL